MSINIRLLLIFLSFQVFAQNASIKGVIVDKNSNEPLIGATIQIVGTYISSATDLEGKYLLKGIKPGDYSIKISYVGYADKLINGVKVKENEDKTLDFTMVEASQTLGEVVVEGEKNLVDLEQGKSSFRVVAEDIKEMSMRDVQQIAAIQPGVNQTMDGLQIRGGRANETQYLVDGISAVDPLAGNGRGVGLSSNSIQELNVTTGNAGSEADGAVSGVVSAKVKEGSNKFSVGASWITDNQNRIWNGKSGWNTDIANLYLGGAIVKDKLFYFSSVDMQLSDDYTIYPKGDPDLNSDFRFKAKQLKSSLLDDPNNPKDVTNSKTWAPRQDNKWTYTLKLSYNIRKGMKISVTNQSSISINQNTRSLLVQGFDAVLQPGFQYYFSRNLDNATTYTHQSNLTAINYKWLFAKKWTYDLSLGRLFTNLRADANGRPFRAQTLDQVYDANSIVTDPVSVFNPNSPIVYVNQGPGVANNNGISDVWHDHYLQEYTVNQKITSHINSNNFLTIGWLHKESELQWVDVTAPWVGAPIKINDSVSTPSISLGSNSDVWKVNSANGGIYINDEIRYKGITATFGLRFSYWTLGKYADDAVNNPNSPIVQPIRDQYIQNTTPLLGRRYNARLLPSIEVKFPITDNNVMFFNYSQTMRNEHPLFFYQGLNPTYSNNSFLSDIGNPALKPNIVSAYEIGLKSQVTKNTAFTFTAFYKDYFDYAVRRTQESKDQTGQFVLKNTYINQDYARIRGLEVVYSQRVSKIIRTTLSVTYQVATGKSNSAAESALQIRQNGFVYANKENYLSWDTPLESKFTFIFIPDSTWRIGRFNFKGYRLFVSSVFRSNQRRYTKVISKGFTPYGREIFEEDVNSQNTELSAPLFWTDIKLSRDVFFTKNAVLSVFVEVKNIFNNKNSQIINPVTGRAYEYGDKLLIDSRDPVYNNPQDNGTPPYDPARYMNPRQFLLGIAYNF